MAQFENVTVVKAANIYFDGKANAKFQLKVKTPVDYCCSYIK